MANLYWYESTNFGDMLSPYLISKYFGDFKTVRHDDPEHKFILTGSILSVGRIKNATIFGAGFVFSNNYFSAENVRVSGVRGPLTLAKIREQQYKHCNLITIDEDVFIGEPALALHIWCKPTVKEKKYRYGIIPHLVDYVRVCNLLKKEIDNGTVCVVNLGRQSHESMDDCVQRIVDDIVSCESVVSSSLHGIIAAMAYNVPVDWVRFSNDIIGDDFKYYDILSATLPSIIEGNGYLKPIDLTSDFTFNDFVAKGNRAFVNTHVDVFKTLVRLNRVLRLK